MKIAHLMHAVAPIGGAETYALALAQAQTAAGDEIAMLPARGADVRGFDVVHVHGTAAVEHRAVVRSLHDYAFGCAAGEHWFRGGGPCNRAHGRDCFRGLLLQGCAHRVDLRPALRRHREITASLPRLRTDEVVVYSSAVRDAAVANGVERVHVIPYFVERVSSPTTPPARRPVYVGRIVPAKGLEVALQALAQIPDRWETFAVVGDGWARPTAEARARKLGIADRVVFHGWLDPQGVGEVLESSTALVMPSRWPEPFGIAGLEALAHARPVVASAVGGIPEWLPATAGALVPPGDAERLAGAIGAVLAQAEALGRAGWEHVARFSVDSHLEQLRRVYTTVAA